MTTTTQRRRNTRNHSLPITVDFLSAAREEIMRQVMATTAVDHKEVGGWLLGSSRATPNSVMVSRVVGMASTDTRDYKHAIMDERHGQVEADIEKLELVGRFHTHPYGNATELSDPDLTSGMAILEGRAKLIDVLVTPGLTESWTLARATAFAYERVAGQVTWHKAIVQGWDDDAAERTTARIARAEGFQRHRIPA